MKKFLLLIFLFFCMMPAMAQITVNGNLSDVWEPSDFYSVENPDVQGVKYGLVAKTNEIQVQSEGFYSVTFTYESGKCALDILGVELLDADGNRLSYDYHVGSAGFSLVNNVYRVLVTNDAKTIRYYADNRTMDSKGTISLEVTREKITDNTDSWKPADWTVVKEIPAEVAALNEYFVSPYVKSIESLIDANRGFLTLSFLYQSGQAALRIGGVELVDLNGNVLSSDYHVGSAGINLVDNVYTVKVPEDGKYILRYYCENKSGGNNSTGNITIAATPIPVINVNEGTPVSTWSHLSSEVNVSFLKIATADIPQGIFALSEAIAPNHVRVYEQIVNVTKTSIIGIEFQYTSGSKALNLAGVDLLDENGNVVASHYKLYDEGSTASVVSKYTLAPVKEGTYTMRSFVQLSSDGGKRIIDSKGNILFNVNTDVITVAKGDSEKEVGAWSKETFVNATSVPEEIAAVSGGVRVMTAVINVLEGGSVLNVEFPWTKGSGSKALDLAGVDIVDGNGNVLSRDYHFTHYGASNGKPYALNITNPGTYVIRYFNGEEGVSSTRSINSTGKVLFTVNDKVFVNATTNFSRDYYYLKGENGKYLSTTADSPALVSEKDNATKFYIEKNGSEYALLSFDKGLYLNFDGSALVMANVGEKYGFILGKGFSPNSVIIGCDDRYLTDALDFTTSLNGYISWTLESVESLSFSISTLRHASLCLPVEVAIPDGVQVYIHTGITYNADGVTGNLNLERIYDHIPANTAVLLYSATPLSATTSYDFAISKTNATLSSTNYFMGTLCKSVIMEESGLVYMYLTKPADKEVGFYKRKIDNDADGDGNADSFILSANKLYFTITPQQAAALSRKFSFNFIDKGTTGVDDVLTEQNTEKVIYDLSGRRIEEITMPGIYIVNGKKVLVK